MIFLKVIREMYVIQLCTSENSSKHSNIQFYVIFCICLDLGGGQDNPIISTI